MARDHGRSTAPGNADAELTARGVTKTIRRHRVFVIVAAITLVAGWLVQSNSRIVDDAFITYRYAANLADGHGLGYNRGEAGLGTTSPGYTIVLAGLATVFGVETLPNVSLALNSLLLALTVGTAGLIAFRLTRDHWAALGFMLLLLLSRPVTGASRMGMETPLFLALVSTGLWSALAGHWRAAAILTGLTFAVRPEGAFAIGLTGVAILVELWRGRLVVRHAVQAITGLTLPGIVQVIALTIYYGSPVPQSAQAKLAGVYPVSTVQTTGQMLLKVADFVPGASANLILYLLAVMAALAVLVTGGRWISRQGPVWWIVPALAALLVAFFANSGTMLFLWYDGLWRGFYVACLWAGLTLVIAALGRWMPRLDRRSAAALAFVWIALAQAADLTRVAAPLDRDPPLDRNREIVYYNLATQIGPLLPDDVVIAMPEIGVLGFYLPQARVLDTAGLVSPEAVDYFPVPEEQCTWGAGGCIPAGLVRDQQPDMVIFVETLGRDSVLRDGSFLAGYVPVVSWRIDETMFEDPGVFVYARRDYAPGMALADHDLISDYPLPYDP